jgi:Alpha-N-acetylglucosaminidase (NAGLU).
MWGTKCTEGQNDDLNLYAYKEWQGVFLSYFKPCWQEFFARLNHSLDTNVAFDRAPYAADMCTWEQGGRARPTRSARSRKETLLPSLAGWGASTAPR